MSEMMKYDRVLPAESRLGEAERKDQGCWVLCRGRAHKTQESHVFHFVELRFCCRGFSEWNGSGHWKVGTRLLFGKRVLPELDRGECLDWHFQNVSIWPHGETPIIKMRGGQEQHYDKYKYCRNIQKLSWKPHILKQGFGSGGLYKDC